MDVNNGVHIVYCRGIFLIHDEYFYILYTCVHDHHSETCNKQ